MNINFLQRIILFFLATISLNAVLALNPENKTLHIRAKTGGLRMFDGEGIVQIYFKGSLLVSGLQGNITHESQIKLKCKKFNRLVYTGSGKLNLNGNFRALQWQGKELNVMWQGKGKAYYIGEYDRSGKNGEYWFSNIARKYPLPTNSLNPIDFSKNKL